MILMHTDTLESIRTPTNDERMGEWAAKYFSGGYHRMSAVETPEQGNEETEQ